MSASLTATSRVLLLGEDVFKAREAEVGKSMWGAGEAISRSRKDATKGIGADPRLAVMAEAGERCGILDWAPNRFAFTLRTCQYQGCFLDVGGFGVRKKTWEERERDIIWAALTTKF